MSAIISVVSSGRRLGIVGVCLTIVAVGTVYAAAGGSKGSFTRTTIDVGVVVGDLDKAAKFYTEAIGFTEVPGFSVSAEMGGGSGLTDDHAFKVRVFVLGKGPTATRLKLMEFPNVASKKVDHRFIHSSLGFSYLTIFISDTTAALERARKAGVTPVKKPYPLAARNKYLTLLRDPDGNIVELVETN